MYVKGEMMYLHNPLAGCGLLIRINNAQGQEGMDYITLFDKLVKVTELVS